MTVMAVAAVQEDAEPSIPDRSSLPAGIMAVSTVASAAVALVAASEVSVADPSAVVVPVAAGNIQLSDV